MQKKATVVSEEEIRRLFADAKIMERVQAGELVEIELDKRTPSPDYGQEEGTLSQYIAYRTKDGKTIAEVHQYLRKDSSLGGSHKPDPKMLLHGGVVYRVSLK